MADASSELALLTASLNKLINTISRTTSDMEDLRVAQLEQSREDEDMLKTLIKRKKLAEDEARNLVDLNSKIKNLNRDAVKFSDQLKDTTLSLEDRAKAEERLASINASLAAEKSKLATAERRAGVSLSDLGKDAKSTSLSFKNLAWAAGSYLVEGLLKQRQLMKDQVVANAGLIEGTDLISGLMHQQYQAITRGIDPVAFGKIMTSNRLMVNAMGGISNTLDAADPTIKRFFGMTMNLEESLQLTAEQMTRFANLGVKPSVTAMHKYTLDVERLAGMTGKSLADIGTFFDEILTDVDSVHLLRAARADEREAIIANQRALVMQNVALGMTTEQAKEAAKMLNRMVAAKPIERMKQAARMRAMGAALGVGGGEEAGQALMAGARATGQQKEMLRDFSVGLTNSLDQMRNAGMGQDILASQLAEKLNLEDTLGKGSPFSTQMGTVIAQGGVMADKYTKAADSALVTAERSFQVLKQIADSVMSGTAVAGGILYLVDKITEEMGIGKPKIEPTTEAGKLMARSTSTSMFDPSGTKDRYADRIKKQISDGMMFEPEEALIIKQNLGIDVPKGSIKGGAAGHVAVTTGTTTMLPTAPSVPEPSLTPERVITTTAPVPQEQRTHTATVATASVDAAKGIQKQVDILDNSNDLLKKIHEATEKQVDLAERQLAAMMLSDQEKTRLTKSAFLQGNNFTTRYGYIPT